MFNIASLRHVRLSDHTVHASDIGRRFNATVFLRHTLYCRILRMSVRLPTPSSSLSRNPIIGVRSIRGFPRCTRMCASCAPVGSHNPHQLLLYKCHIFQCIYQYMVYCYICIFFILLYLIFVILLHLFIIYFVYFLSIV